MNLIQEFYNNLDTLEMIIFWGIIIVIILVIILIIILINKNKKTKNIVIDDIVEEFPIKINELTEDEHQENIINNNEEILFDTKNENNLLEEIEPIIEIEKEQVSEIKEENKYQTTFEIPSAPYQKNVLRGMSLSQTSPIGINRRDDYIKPEELFEMYNKHEEKQEPKEPEIKQEIINIEENIEENVIEEYPDNEDVNEEEKKYDLDIERTQYEIEQEENAIISYKELMEKKDSIQTIDEEDAIISIEELLNKTNSKEEIKEESKLYNISEEEENESFINELKQFRKDL